MWRGYNLRCKLLKALDFAKFDDEEEEFGEIDMNDLNFNEVKLLQKLYAFPPCCVKNLEVMKRTLKLERVQHKFTPGLDEIALFS